MVEGDVESGILAELARLAEFATFWHTAIITVLSPVTLSTAYALLAACTLVCLSVLALSAWS